MSFWISTVEVVVSCRVASWIQLVHLDGGLVVVWGDLVCVCGCSLVVCYTISGWGVLRFLLNSVLGLCHNLGRFGWFLFIVTLAVTATFLILIGFDLDITGLHDCLIKESLVLELIINFVEDLFVFLLLIVNFVSKLNVLHMVFVLSMLISTKISVFDILLNILHVFWFIFAYFSIIFNNFD